MLKFTRTVVAEVWAFMDRGPMVLQVPVIMVVMVEEAEEEAVLDLGGVVPQLVVPMEEVEEREDISRTDPPNISLEEMEEEVLFVLSGPEVPVHSHQRT